MTTDHVDPDEVRERIKRAKKRADRERPKPTGNGPDPDAVPLTINQKRAVIQELTKLDLLNYTSSPIQ
jgi:hypothetical protein